jgi:hypothetical protein
MRLVVREDELLQAVSMRLGVHCSSKGWPSSKQWTAANDGVRNARREMRLESCMMVGLNVDENFGKVLELCSSDLKGLVDEDLDVRRD